MRKQRPFEFETTSNYRTEAELHIALEPKPREQDRISRHAPSDERAARENPDGSAIMDGEGDEAKGGTWD